MGVFPKGCTISFIKTHSKSTYVTRIQSVTPMHVRKRCTSDFPTFLSSSEVLTQVFFRGILSCENAVTLDHGRATPLGELESKSWSLPVYYDRFMMDRPGWMVPHGVSSFLFSSQKTHP